MISDCKSKLALDEAHTYNPPHRKRALAVLTVRAKPGVYGARRVGAQAACVLEKTG